MPVGFEAALALGYWLRREREHHVSWETSKMTTDQGAPVLACLPLVSRQWISRLHGVPGAIGIPSAGFLWGE